SAIAPVLNGAALHVEFLHLTEGVVGEVGLCPLRANGPDCSRREVAELPRASACGLADDVTACVMQDVAWAAAGTVVNTTEPIAVGRAIVESHPVTRERENVPQPDCISKRIVKRK